MADMQGVHHVADLHEQGVSRRQIRSAVRAGRIVRLRRGIYCDRAAWERSQGSQPARHAIEVYAAMLALGQRERANGDSATSPELGRGGCASGYSAALLHELPVPKGQPEQVELSLPHRQYGRHTYPDLRIRTASIEDDDVAVVRGVLVTTPARTALDVARHDNLAAGLVLADAGLRRRVIPPGHLDLTAQRMLGWPHASRVRLVAQHASALRESPGESVSFAVFVEARLPLPECNAWVIGHGHGGVRSDFLWAAHRLVGEVDGNVKYTDPRWDAPEHVLLEEKKRQLRLEEAGFVVVRWTPAEIVHRPSTILERIVRQSHVAARMHGVPPLVVP